MQIVVNKNPSQDLIRRSALLEKCTGVKLPCQAMEHFSSQRQVPAFVHTDSAILSSAAGPGSSYGAFGNDWPAGKTGKIASLVPTGV